jgi:tetratricopeptide (TPR) repeat protein
MIIRFFVIFLFLASAAAVAQTNTADSSKPASPSAATSTTASAAGEALISANALLNARKYSEAEAAFKSIVAKDPASPQARAGLIRSLMRQRKFTDAEEAGKSAVLALPSSSLVHAAFGDVNFRTAQMAEAEAEYKAALRLDANSARGNYGMGRLYTMLSMYKHAKQSFARAHELDPSDDDIFRAWIESLPRADAYEQYKQHLQKEHSKKTDSADAKQEDDSGDLDDDSALSVLKTLAEKKPWDLAKAPQSTAIKLEPIAESGQYFKGFGLHVTFNDHVSSNILLDTGASSVVIGSRLANKIGVTKIADSAFSGVGEGFTKSYIGLIEKIKIGDVEFRNCIVEVSSKPDVADGGLIGADIFEKYLVTLDFEQRKLLLNPLPKNPESTGNDEEALDRYIAPEMQSFTKIYRFGHDLVLPATLGTAKKNATGLFILDTGSFANTISLDLAKKLTKVTYQEGSVTGVSAKIKEIFAGDTVYLHFAGVHVRSDDITAFDHRSVANGTEISGLIGITTLVQMKITIDYRDGLVKIEPYQTKKV